MTTDAVPLHDVTPGDDPVTELAANGFAPIARLRDTIELGKPRLSMLVIFTSATGVWLAPQRPGLLATVSFLLATSCLVAGANAINSWMERESDARMIRTRGRPLPAGRLAPGPALAYGIGVSLLALVWLYLASNPLTTLLGGVALFTYVLVYTPLKRLTPWALVVGAVPGAIPPLMGWTAATGSLDAPGWFLFGVLFLWQLPHFIAIAIHLSDDFRRGGIRALPVVHGEPAARRHLFLYTLALVVYSLLGSTLGFGGAAYAVTAAVLGAGFLGYASIGLRRRVGSAWSRRLFAYTLLYLPVLVAVLVLDRV
jgi:protoheme IX farnesyltransferase